MGKKEHEKKSIWAKCIRFGALYVFLLCLATLLSLRYYGRHQPEPGAKMNVVRVLTIPLEDAFAAETWVCAGESLESLVRGAAFDKCAAYPRHKEAAGHPEQPLDEGFRKIWIVLLISLLWFVTFLAANAFKVACLKQRRGPRAPPPGQDKVAARLSTSVKWTLALISILFPVIPFVISMHEAYEPAVLVMALVAIFVAAEHYIGLREAEHELEEKTGELLEVMETVLNADALAEWRAEMYGLYAKATVRIDAVIRHFDIDVKWWKCADSPDPWGDYFKSCTPNDGTLFTALRHSKADVQFVADLELPFLGPQPPDAKFFRNLLGVAWQLAMFKKVQEERKHDNVNKCLHIKITHAVFWMHVIDEVVYQVIERGDTETATVRELTRSSSNPKELSDWSRLSIEHIAERGGPAEEYVFSVLRYGALKVKCWDWNDLNKVRLAKILNGLGMQEYLGKPNDEFLLSETGVPDNPVNKSVKLSLEAAETMCIAVFRELIEQRLKARCADPKRDEGETVCHVEDLLCAIV